MSTERNKDAEVADYADEIGTIGVPLHIAKEVVQLCWHDNHVPLLIGESSTGKTAAISQLARLNKMDMIPFHLGNVDSTDIRGPMFPQEGGTFTFLKPGNIPVKWQPSVRQRRVLYRLEEHGISLEDILADDYNEASLPATFTEKDRDTVFGIRQDQEKEGRKAALFFDEANRGSKDTNNAVMSVWQERHLGDAELGPNVRICAAMNPPGGAYTVSTQFSQDPAMRRRVCQIVVHFSVGEFLNFAENPSKQAKEGRVPAIDYDELQNRDPFRPYHPTVVKYLRQKPAVAMDSGLREAGKIYGCPATWEAVSDTMYTVERLDLDVDDPVMRQIVQTKLAGNVGYSEAAAFLEAYGKEVDMLDPLDVLFNYTPKTACWKKVQKVLAQSEYMGLTEVVKAAIEMIVDPAHEEVTPEAVVPQLGHLINDLPANIAQEALRHVAKTADELGVGVNETIRQLMSGLTKNPQFEEYRARTLEMMLKYQEQQADAANEKD